MDGDTIGSKGSFKQDVTMTVGAEAKAKLERTTRGGGVEQLSGYISPVGHLQLQGHGKNTPDDTWMTVFIGDVKVDGISAEGRITDPEGDRTLRNCRLLLKRMQHDHRISWPLTKCPRYPAITITTLFYGAAFSQHV